MNDTSVPYFYPRVGKVLIPTNEFRWMKYKGRRDTFMTLQQAWIDNHTGDVEWKNIPEVDVPENVYKGYHE